MIKKKSYFSKIWFHTLVCVFVFLYIYYFQPVKDYFYYLWHWRSRTKTGGVVVFTAHCLQVMEELKVETTLTEEVKKVKRRETVLVLCHSQHKRYVNKIRYLDFIVSSAANEQTEQSVASPEFGSELQSWSILIIHQSEHLTRADESDEVLQNHSSASLHIRWNRLLESLMFSLWPRPLRQSPPPRLTHRYRLSVWGLSLCNCSTLIYWFRTSHCHETQGESSIRHIQPHNEFL